MTARLANVKEYKQWFVWIELFRYGEKLVMYDGGSLVGR